ncbi:MAG: KOW domain-containing RNA-binding protein [Oscillospiraceae bacterium]|nr:KOW domain-containing RNA-binding protein [Oscillospiraceae bacterium]
MKVCKGDIVRSQNGRDKGKSLFVAEVDGEFLVLVDGKSRKVEHPKRKKEKHCMFLVREDSRVAEKLRSGERVNNSDIRKALAAFRNNAQAGQTETGEVE